MTSQIDDTVIIDGEDAVGCTGPVIAKDHPCIYKLADDEVNPLANFSACWRAFQAEWEIKNNRLYLNKIIGKYKILSEEPIFADWFTGTLRANKGEILVYGPDNEWVICEFNIKIVIKEGLVLENDVTDNRDKDLNELIHRYTQAGFPPII